jgi:hypothetical protein
MMDIFVLWISNAWQKNILELEFDSITHTPQEFVEVCEWISMENPIINGRMAKTMKNAGNKGAL